MPLKLPGQIVVPAEHWFGSALHCSINWLCSDQTQRHAAPAFSPHRSAVLDFMSRWWPAWRDALKVIQPETVLRWRRHGIALICKYRSRGRWRWRWRGGRPKIALAARELIREMVHANFLWGAPRIHGELLKLGSTVSQATVSRCTPPSRKDRRSQAWRTFIRNHAITIVQSRRLNGHDWARDLLSQVGSRSRAFTYHLSAFVVGPHRSVVLGCLAYGPSTPCGRTRPRVRFTRNATLTAKSTALAYQYQPAARTAGQIEFETRPPHRS
jgi:hypothetical protein